MTIQILTTEHWSDFLSDEAIGADRIELLVKRAEKKVLDRYRETEPDGRFTMEGVDGDPLEQSVQLDGWIEDDSGDPDVQAIGEELLFALRDAIARIVEFWVDKPDEAEHVARMDQGDRRVDFRDKDLPSSVFSGLRRFDETGAWH